MLFYCNKKCVISMIMLVFVPYKTIDYQTKNVEIIETLENLSKILEDFGYKYNVNNYEAVNVSNKIRGKLNEENTDRVKRKFNKDVKIYNMVINSVLKM